ncbi:MAG: restriction endonuclease subunit S [Bacteroidota bacterium]
MKRFKYYKDSGIDWIGEIPEHWVLTKLKFLGDAIGGLTYSPNDVVLDEGKGVLVLRSSNIQGGQLSLQDNVYVSIKVPEKLILRKGDILICSRNGSQHLIGKNICINEEMVGNTFGAFMMIFRSKDWRFLRHFFNSPIFTSQSALFLTATINQLTSNTLNNFWIAIPKSIDEQTLIAKYLDKKTRQIDKLISDKQKLIELFNEERIAMINLAVTKGIDPNVPMKDSGVEWLGEIPEHWRIDKLKRFCELITDGSHSSPESRDHGKRYISVKDVGENSIDFKNCKYISETDFEMLEKNGCRPKRDDILLTKDGTIGRAVIVTEDNDFVILSSLAIIRPKFNLCESAYLKQFLLSSLNVNQMLSNLQGSALTRITLTIINNLYAILPPIEEQKRIRIFIDEQIINLDSLISKVNQEINLLKEYKTALISEVVTGKVDIRDEITSELEFETN